MELQAQVLRGRHAPLRRSPWAGATAALLLATAVVWSGLGGPSASTAITDGASVATALGAAWLVHRTGRGRSADRTAWQLLCVALLLWGAGEVIWGTQEVVLHDAVPFPSIADAAYLGAVPFAVASLLAFARGSGARFHLRALLDGCLVGASLLFITWAMVLGPLWRAQGGSPWAHVVNVAYPVTDLVLAVLALVIVRWGNTSARSSLRVVVAALLVMAVADTCFTWLTTNGTYASTNPISMLWPAAYLLLASSTRFHGRGTRRERPLAESAGSVLTPYVPVLGAIAVGAPRFVAGHPLGPFLTANGLGLVALLLVRQAITALDLGAAVSTLQAREAELARLALEDPLTGLANRTCFTARLEAAVGVPYAEPAVIFIDLDAFKDVNDRFGHAAGDQLLIEVGRRLEACMTPSMVLARLGGDEFVILVTRGHEEAVAVTKRILQAFVLPFHRDGASIPFQASLGIGVAPIGGSPDEAVRRADAAMYVAKSTGRGRAVDYPDETLVCEQSEVVRSS